MASTELIVCPITAAPHEISQTINLMRTCFPKAKKYTEAFLNWQYSENPEGKAVGFNAFDGDTLAATYVCLPATVILEGQTRRALLSLNTATHPTYQGQGLFVNLAQKTYELAASSGFDVVFGVANQNSIGGFAHKLGFQDVGGLAARIGTGPFPLTRPIDIPDLQFRRVYSAAALKWRSANAMNALSFKSIAPGEYIVSARTQFPTLRATAFVECSSSSSELSIDSGTKSSSLNWLFIGSPAVRNGISFPIPDRLKPSPLRLIYKNLHDRNHKIRMDRILFSFFDFDPY